MNEMRKKCMSLKSTIKSEKEAKRAAGRSPSLEEKSIGVVRKVFENRGAQQNYLRNHCTIPRHVF